MPSQFDLSPIRQRPARDPPKIRWLACAGFYLKTCVTISGVAAAEERLDGGVAGAYKGEGKGRSAQFQG
jgi:hypothetical protein